MFWEGEASAEPLRLGVCGEVVVVVSGGNSGVLRSVGVMAGFPSVAVVCRLRSGTPVAGGGVWGVSDGGEPRLCGASRCGGH